MTRKRRLSVDTAPNPGIVTATFSPEATFPAVFSRFFAASGVMVKAVMAEILYRTWLVSMKRPPAGVSRFMRSSLFAFS